MVLQLDQNFRGVLFSQYLTRKMTWDFFSLHNTRSAFLFCATVVPTQIPGTWYIFTICENIILTGILTVPLLEELNRSEVLQRLIAAPPN